MSLPSYYSTGTASIDNAATTVTGTGTTWTAALRAGDLFGIHIGLAVPIASVDSDTQLTLAFAWPGATQSAAAYAVQIVPDVARMQETTRRVLEQISEGNLQVFAGLTAAADKLAYFTGAGTMDVADFKTSMRAMLGLTPAINQIPYFKDAGGGVVEPGLAAITALGLELLGDADGSALASNMPATLTADKAFRRGNILGTVSQSGGVPTGALIEVGTGSNGTYARFADGTQICWFNTAFSLTPFAEGVVYGSGASGYFWTFPAAFSGQPVAFVSNAGSDWFNTSMMQVSTTGGRLKIMSGYNTPLSETYNFGAIGRWN